MAIPCKLYLPHPEKITLDIQRSTVWQCMETINIFCSWIFSGIKPNNVHNKAIRAVTNIRTLESSRTHLEIRTQIFACLCFARFANIPIFYSYSNYKIISFEWICFCAKIVTLKKKLAYLFTCDCRIRNMLCPKLLLVKLEVQFRIIINWRNNKFLRKWRSQTHL